MKNSTGEYWISTHEGIPTQTREVLNEYLLNIKLANKTESTISKYRSILEQFCSECLVLSDSLNHDDVLKWVNKFSAGKKESTVKRVLSILNNFFTFCYVFNYLDKLLLKKRCGPKVPELLSTSFTNQGYAIREYFK